MDIKITIKGISPLVMDRFTEEALESLGKSSRASAKGQKPLPHEEAYRATYHDDDGNLYFPAQNLFSAIIEAGKFHKFNKAKVTTAKSSLVPAAIIMKSIICHLNTKDFEVWSHRVVNQNNGMPAYKHSPILHEWQLTFEIELDTDEFSPDFTRMLIDDAGKKIGIGYFRPSKRGPYGRFVVTEWVQE